MLTKKQVEILGVFYDNLFAELTFKEIKEKSRQKSNNILQLAIKEFKNQNLLILNKIGSVTTYKLNLENNLTLSYLNTINEYKLTKLNSESANIIYGIENKIRRKTIFFILAIFGSFAKGKVTENSDLDVAILINNDDLRKKIIPVIETIKRREIQTIDYHIMTISEFQEMLSADYENLGKQIYKNNIIYYGYISYLKLLVGMKK